MIRIKNLSKRVEKFSLKGINLDIKDGEYSIILGPTGSGKTMLLECIAGLQKADGGGIWINGINVTELPPEKRGVGFVYQDYLLFPNMNIAENIRFGLKFKNFSGNEIDKKIKKISELLQISDLLNRNPKTLSGGEQQRVALARALVTEPDILLLDEPLSALDPEIRSAFQEELRKIHNEIRTTTVHVTHNFEEAISLADRVAVMNNGEIIQSGRPEEIFRKPRSEFVANFVGIENIFNGISQREGGIARISINNTLVYAITQKTGNVRISIRPEDITISKENIGSSARNIIWGRITGITDKGPLVKVIVDIGMPLVVLITRGSYESMNFNLNSYVYVSFKAGGVHVF